jgi:hypothetical protein
VIFQELAALANVLITESRNRQNIRTQLNLKLQSHELWNFFAAPFWQMMEYTIPDNFHWDSDAPRLHELSLTCEVWKEQPEFVLAADTSAGDFEFQFQAAKAELTQLLIRKDFGRWLSGADGLISEDRIFGRLLQASWTRCPEAMRPLGVDWLTVSYGPQGAITQCDLRTSSLAASEVPIADFVPFQVTNYHCSITALASPPDRHSYTLNGWFHLGGHEMSLEADLTEQGAASVEAELATVVSPRGRGRSLITEPMLTSQLVEGISGPAGLLAGLPFQWNVVTAVVGRPGGTFTLSASTPECWQPIGSPTGQFTSGAWYQIEGARVSDLELSLSIEGTYWRLNLQGIFFLDAKPWPSWFEIDLGQLDDYQLSRVCFGRRYFVREGLESVGAWITQLPRLYQDTIPVYTGESHVNVLFLPDQRGGLYFEEFNELLARKGS